MVRRREGDLHRATALSGAAGFDDQGSALCKWSTTILDNIRCSPPSCSIRRGPYNMVRTANDKPWELYDLKSDPGETKSLTNSNPQIVTDLSQAYDAWWTSILPDLTNEDATGPKINPFKEQYEKQFGPVKK